jgi:hypothetical protein
MAAMVEVGSKCRNHAKRRGTLGGGDEGVEKRLSATCRHGPKEFLHLVENQEPCGPRGRLRQDAVGELRNWRVPQLTQLGLPIALVAKRLVFHDRPQQRGEESVHRLASGDVVGGGHDADQPVATARYFVDFSGLKPGP